MNDLPLFGFMNVCVLLSSRNDWNNSDLVEKNGSESMLKNSGSCAGSNFIGCGKWFVFLLRFGRSFCFVSAELNCTGFMRLSVLLEIGLINSSSGILLQSESSSSKLPRNCNSVCFLINSFLNFVKSSIFRSQFVQITVEYARDSWKFDYNIEI